MRKDSHPIFHRPPPGRPHWLPDPPEVFDLIYLAWGRRTYGQNPSPVSTHDGWTYLAVVSGKPILVRPDGNRVLHRGQAVIIAPECAFGWTDEPRGTCEIVSWIWRTPNTVAPPDASSLVSLVSLSRRQLQRIQSLHALCRDETQWPDHHSPKVLSGLRIELDAVFARAGSKRPPQDISEWRLHLALEWLRTQIAAPEPVTALCDYLQVSPSTLNRLFHARLGMSAKQHIHETRMAYAMSLRPGLRIKEIAERLGYKYPNDLSRALIDYQRSRC